MKKKIKTTKNKKYTLLFVTVLFVVASGYAFFEFNDNTSPSDTKEVIATNDASSQGYRKEVSPNPSKTRNGGVTDTEGADTTDTDQSTSSKSGKITVFSPAKDSIIQNGGSFSGASTLSTVSYRLIDDQIGVIGSGALKVVNGKFSGKFDFSSSGADGRLDVFRALSDGREVDTVEIPVRYK